jgi:beta-xylosidase
VSGFQFQYKGTSITRTRCLHSPKPSTTPQLPPHPPFTVTDEKWDSYYYRKSIKPLIHFGLLQRIKGDWPGVTMHGLVQWRAKKQHDGQPWTHLLSAFVTAVAHQFNRGKDRPLFRRFASPNMLAVRPEGIGLGPGGEKSRFSPTCSMKISVVSALTSLFR